MRRRSWTRRRRGRGEQPGDHLLRVGLTGGIGSGKSTVTGLFQSLGCPILNLDEVSRKITGPGQPALAAIAAALGPDVLRPDGSLDRARVASMVFADPDARSRLEGILHPAILQSAGEWVRAKEQELDSPRAVLLEIPLLFEAGLETTVDRIVLVTAEPAIRMDRLARDRGMSHNEALSRMAAQLPDSYKQERSHYVIHNNGSLDELKAQVEQVWKQISHQSPG